MNYKIVISGFFIATCMMALSPLRTSAQTTDVSALVQQIQALLETINGLQQQIATLQGQQNVLRGEIKESLALTRELRRGMSDEEVKVLQEILATDPSIYPEGIVSGMYGPLTEKAVKNFQKKHGIEQVGNVGPKTRAKLNELLSEGAGNSGKVPPGLLIAPGLKNKIGENAGPLPGQKLPPGIAKKMPGYENPTTTPATTTPDTTVPVISLFTATSTASTSITTTWVTNEIANGFVWVSTSTPVVTTGVSSASSTAFTLGHSFTISGLMASTTYYYVGVSKDMAGNTATTTEQSIITRSE